MLLQIMFILMMATALVLAIGYFRGGWNLFGNREHEAGTLYVTGVSPRPNALEDSYVTISGNISGPSLVAHETYGRFIWDINHWPSIGEQIPVLYPSGKPDHWFPNHPGARQSASGPFHG
ncbi:hypothetical protein [Nocardia sp. NPDC050406]|uniref:hypothetical protein n=1 Tax=Nocardia sp. NPDC050406 TaxID=3364318 RepID=UPI00379E57DE